MNSTTGVRRITDSQAELLTKSGISTSLDDLIAYKIQSVETYEELGHDTLAQNISRARFAADAPFLRTEMVGLHGDPADSTYRAFQIRSDKHNKKKEAGEAEEEETYSADPTTPKALQGGKGSHITMCPPMRERWVARKKVGAPVRLVIQEGTRQGVAASQAALACEDESVVVAVVWGCQNWTNGEGAPHPAITMLAGYKGITEVIISLDGDRTSKHSVWTGAKRLKTAVIAAGVDPANVKYTVLPTTKASAGMDDVLGPVPKKERPAYFLRILNELVTTKEGREPAKKKQDRLTMPSALAPIVDETARRIIDAPKEVVHGGQVIGVTEGNTWAEFAARITRTVTLLDDLRPFARAEVKHDIDIMFQDGTIARVKEWPDAQLGQITALLEQAAGGEGTAQTYDKSPKGFSQIEMAMRAHRADEREYVRVYKRLGWVELPGRRAGYVFPGGVITEEGVSGEAFARLSRDEFTYGVNFPDVTDEQVREALDRLLRELDEIFIDTTPVWVTLGLIWAALAGFRPRGTVGVIGGSGAGKTSIVTGCTTCFGTAFSYSNNRYLGMSLRGHKTAGAIDSAGYGLHNAVALLDDVKAQPTQRKREKLTTDLQGWISQGMEGRAGVAARQSQDKNGEYQTKTADYSEPLRMFTAENLTCVDLIESDLNRMLAIRTTKDNTYRVRKVSAAAWESLAEDGVLNVLAAAFIKHMAGVYTLELANPDVTLEDVIKSRTAANLNGARGLLDEKLDEAGQAVAHSRQVDVAALPLAGLWQFRNGFRRYGVGSRAFGSGFLTERIGQVYKALVEHDQTVRMAGADESMSIFEKVRLVAGDHAISGRHDDEDGWREVTDRGRKFIGTYGREKVDGKMVDVVFLSHAKIAPLIDESPAAVRAALTEHCIPAPKSMRNGWRKSLNKGEPVVPVVCLPLSVWVNGIED